MKTYSEKRLEDLRVSGRILRGALEAVEKSIKPGVSTLELDRIAEQYILAQGGGPSFKGYEGYLFTICASINQECIHGLPGKKRILKEGDIVSIDVGVRYPVKGGMCTDAARTFAVGRVSAEARDLIKITEGCFYAAVEGLRAGDAVSSIGQKIEKFVNGRYGIIDTWMGHGIGDDVHEPPAVPNFDITKHHKSEKFKRIAETNLIEGAVICIEPMINAGTKDVRQLDDGWTVVTADGKLAAHFENTIIIHKDKIEIVT